MKINIWLLMGMGMAGGMLCADETALPGKKVDGIAAQVNHRVITQAEVRAVLTALEPNIRRAANGDADAFQEKMRAATMDVLNKMVENALILDAFEKEKNASGGSLHIPEEWIDRQVRESIHRDYDNDQSRFVKTLQVQGISLTEFRKQIREQTMVQVMREREVNANIFISPFKIEKYYQQHQAEYQVGDQVKLRMIFLKKEDGKRALAEEIVKQLDGGAKFVDLAKKHSEDRRDGEAAWYETAKLNADLVKVAAGLKAGQHSAPLETGDGFWILQGEETKPAHVRPIAEMRDEIEKILTQQERERVQREWIQRLKRDAHIRYF